MVTWTPGARVLSHPGANWAQSRCSTYMLIDFYHFLGATAGQPYRTECRRLLMGEPRQSPHSSALTPPLFAWLRHPPLWLHLSPLPQPQVICSLDPEDSVLPGLPASTLPLQDCLRQEAATSIFKSSTLSCHCPNTRSCPLLYFFHGTYDNL